MLSIFNFFPPHWTEKSDIPGEQHFNLIPGCSARSPKFPVEEVEGNTEQYNPSLKVLTNVCTMGFSSFSQNSPQNVLRLASSEEQSWKFILGSLYSTSVGKECMSLPGPLLAPTCFTANERGPPHFLPEPGLAAYRARTRVQLSPALFG